MQHGIILMTFLTFLPINIVIQQLFSVLFIEVILKKKCDKRPSKIYSRKKKKPFTREKNFLVMKEQLCFLKSTTSLMMGLFFFFS
jgi:hypothetical protein